MYKINDYVVYNKNVCQIKDIKTSSFNKENCYVLVPVHDDSLTISVPVSKTGFLRDIITKDEVLKLIDKIPSIEKIDKSEKLLESEYKNKLKEGSYEDLIAVIKTAYLRNKKRTDDNKKISDKDNNYFLKAENFLYSELSIALEMSYDETRDYVINAVSKQVGEI